MGFFLYFIFIPQFSELLIVCLLSYSLIFLGPRLSHVNNGQSCSCSSLIQLVLWLSDKTKLSLYKTSASLAISLAGMLGGKVGSFTGFAGMILTLRSYAPKKDVYIKIKRYYNRYTREIKNDYLVYKNSNYTGLLKTYTHRYRPYG